MARRQRRAVHPGQPDVAEHDVDQLMREQVLAASADSALRTSNPAVTSTAHSGTRKTGSSSTTRTRVGRISTSM